jgi:hypothetical protein
MGGGGGSSRSIGDIQSLVDRAKKELQMGEQTGRRNIFISFAHEDVATVNLLRAQARNERLPLEFNDWSVSEPINSERATYIKQKIAARIAQSSVTVVFVSNDTAKSEWVSWEVEESIKQGKHVVGVYPQNARPAVMPATLTRNRIKAVPWPDLPKTIERLK